MSSNYFQGLRVEPLLGRPFRDDEDRIGAEPAVIVSHRFWVNRLASDPRVLDRAIRVNNASTRIVGIAPAGFFGLRRQWPDIFTPPLDQGRVPARAAGRHRAGRERSQLVGSTGCRLAGDLDASARVQMAGLFRNMVISDGTKGIPELITLPGRRGFNALNARDANALWILMLLVGVLLLVVCTNVTNFFWRARSGGNTSPRCVSLSGRREHGSSGNI